MAAYIIRRLLLMIPTFFGISVVIFAVLNLAPGRPAAGQSADQASTLEGQATQESYRIFKEQFALDKPALINTRFALSEADISRELNVVSGERQASTAERIASQERLEGYGSYAIPHLITLLRARRHQADRFRDSVLAYLRLGAYRPLKDPFNPAPSDELRAHNKGINSENGRVAELRFSSDATEEQKQEVVVAWLAWYDAHRARFHFTTTEKVKIFFFDTRFARYWGNLIRFDFGVSLVTKEPVLTTLLGKLKYSLVLSIGSLLLAYLIAIPLGVFSAIRRDTSADRVLTVLLFMLYSLPTFFVATLLLYFVSEGSTIEPLRLFPTGGWQSGDAQRLTFFEQISDVAWHITLPLFCMTYGSLAAISRYMRTGLLEVIAADYIRTAYAKGLPERLVVGKHALRNGLLPILTLLAGLLPAVLGGSVIIEYIFGIPGMGLWVVESIYQRDYNVIMSVQLLTTMLVLVGILVTDLSYALVDPRIRYT